MIRISCVLTLALALTSCGEQGNTAGERGDTDGQQGDTAGAVSFEVGGSLDAKGGGLEFGTVGGSVENATAKQVVDQFLEHLPNLFGPLYGYEVTNKLIGNPEKKFTFKFELKTLADLKALLEKELNATVILDEKAKTLTVE